MLVAFCIILGGPELLRFDSSQLELTNHPIHANH